jgi:integrase
MEVNLKSAGDVTVPASTPQTGNSGSNPTTRPSRDGRMTLAALIDAYMRAYSGKDGTRTQRIGYWSEKLGHVAIAELDDDAIADALAELAARRGTYYAGKDASGRKVMRAKAKPVSGSTLNRYLAALSAALTWAQKQRITPRHWQNPCRFVRKEAENPAKLRFLDRGEIDRLLQACIAQKWPKLHLIVLMAVTTGCRRAELAGLHWGDVDAEAALACLADTKNAEPRRVPLLDSVIAELKRFSGKRDELVFGSTRRPGQAFNFEPQWQRALKLAGIRGATFHTLRHTAASHLVMGGASLHETGQVLGHRTTQMTARYAHLSTQHKASLVRRVLGDIGVKQ